MPITSRLKHKNYMPLMIAAFAVLLAWVFFAQFTADTKQKKPASQTAVTVIKAYTEEVSDNLEALGTANANEFINITAAAAETISEIRFSDGQNVRKGDVIALLEQREERAELAAAKVQLAEHQRELERMATLLSGKAVSQRDYEARKTLMQITQQQIDAIQARIEERTLRAPFDGTLGIRRLSVGALVQPGDIITTIDDIKTIKLDFSVPAMFLSSLAPGVAIEAYSDALNGRRFSGTIEHVDTRVDPVTRSILVRALLDNEDGAIRPGLLMRVVLLKNMRTPIVVPEESVLMRQQSHYVLIVNPETNKVEERRITPGVRRPGILEVLEGVSLGEQVIVRGVNRVRDGSAVTIQEVWDKARAPVVNAPGSINSLSSTSTSVVPLPEAKTKE